MSRLAGIFFVPYHDTIDGDASIWKLQTSLRPLHATPTFSRFCPSHALTNQAQLRHRRASPSFHFWTMSAFTLADALHTQQHVHIVAGSTSSPRIPLVNHPRIKPLPSFFEKVCGQYPFIKEVIGYASINIAPHSLSAADRDIVTAHTPESINVKSMQMLAAAPSSWVRNDAARSLVSKSQPHLSRR